MIRLQVAVGSGRLELDKRLVRTVLRAAGSEVAAAARSLIRKSAGSGRMYRGPGGSAAQYRGGYTKGPHRASSAGQPPSSITGTLARSIAVRPFKNGEGVAVRDTAFYALFLEAGAQGGVGSGRKGVKGRRNKRGGVAGNRVLSARPFLTTALQAREASIAQRVAQAINQGVKFQRMRP